jgi:hypothetical protein
MPNRDSGEGRLVSLEADQSEYFVEYEIDIDTQTAGSSERFAPLTGVKNYTLRVKPHGYDQIRDGEYTLKTKRGVLRVRKVGLGWQVVQP